MNGDGSSNTRTLERQLAAPPLYVLVPPIDVSHWPATEPYGALIGRTHARKGVSHSVVTHIVRHVFVCCNGYIQ